MSIDWETRMSDVVDSALLLKNRNVIDLSFIDGSIIEVYIAILPNEKAIGLSKISYLDLDGMLFVYESPSLTPFTVSQMKIDLNIAWYRKDGTMIKKQMFEAGYAGPIFSPEPYSYVLETTIGVVADSDLLIH